MEWFANIFNHPARHYTACFIPKERVDIDYDDGPVRTGAAYCKLWLVEMHLAKDIEWGDKRYPVVHSATSYFYGTNRVTIPCLADEDTLKDLAQRNRDRIIACNYELTPVFPYKKETVAVRAGLFSLIDNSLLKASIQVMGQLSSLIPATSGVSQVLKLSEPLGNGIRNMLNIQDKRLELGYIQTFAQAGSGGSNILRPGYFVAMRAEEGTVDTSSLCIIQDHLCSGAPGTQKEFLRQHTPLMKHSYMLFRFEANRQRNWHELTEIESLVLNARDAVVNSQYEEVRKYLLPAIKVAILRSPDIAEDDRIAMIARVEKTLAQSGLQSTAGADLPRSLHAIMQQPLPPPDPQLDAEIEQLRELLKL